MFAAIIIVALCAVVIHTIVVELRNRWSVMRWAERLARMGFASFVGASGITGVCLTIGINTVITPGVAIIGVVAMAISAVCDRF